MGDETRAAHNGLQDLAPARGIWLAACDPLPLLFFLSFQSPNPSPPVQTRRDGGPENMLNNRQVAMPAQTPQLNNTYCPACGFRRGCHADRDAILCAALIRVGNINAPIVPNQPLFS